MNILIVTAGGGIAGSTNSIYYLSRGLARRGHQVYLACPEYRLLYEMAAEGPMERIALDFTTTLDWKAAKALARIVKEKEIEIVNTQDSRDRYAAMLARQFFGLRAVTLNTRRQNPKSDGGPLVNKLIARYFEAIVAVSPAIKKALVGIGYPERKVRVIPNGTPREKYEAVDPLKVERLRQKFKMDGSKPVLGSISRPKEHIQLLQALTLLDRPVKLILVGQEESPEYRKVIDSYRLDHEVYFEGSVPNEEALNYYPLFDLKILPSNNEGLSQSLLEAMALGVPVIATNLAGNPDLVRQGENGFLFESGDIEGLKGCIERLLNDSKLRENFSKAGKKTALEEFNLEVMLDRYEALYRELLSRQ